MKMPKIFLASCALLYKSRKHIFINMWATQYIKFDCYHTCMMYAYLNPTLFNPGARKLATFQSAPMETTLT
jgi:hypothetical protein